MQSIVVNIGNTNIRFGLFLDQECKISWVINTKPYRTSDEFYVQLLNLYQNYDINLAKVEKVIVGSVVPQLSYPILRTLKKIHKLSPIFVDRNTRCAVTANSNQMGTDIYANVVAAHYLYPQRKKLILDFGTALTAECVDEQGSVLGVVIAPGIMTSLKSLTDLTAQLPEIELKVPKSVLGLDTVSCMQSGMIYGFLGMVEGLIDRINNEVKDDCYVIGTGGLSHVYQPLTAKIHIADKLHTLKGLHLLGSVVT